MSYMVLLHKVGIHSATPTVATMCGLSHCWVTKMMLGNAGDLKQNMAEPVAHLELLGAVVLSVMPYRRLLVALFHPCRPR